MTADDQPIPVTLTVRQWREIQADLDLRRREPYLPLLDELDDYDLTGDCDPELADALDELLGGGPTR